MIELGRLNFGPKRSKKVNFRNEMAILTAPAQMQEGQGLAPAVQESHWTMLGLQATDHMKWIYTALVRPTITYAAMTWINGLYKQQNLAKLKSVQTKRSKATMIAKK